MSQTPDLIPYPPTWEHLVALEPRLGDLHEAAIACGHWSVANYYRFRERAQRLVGWHAEGRDRRSGDPLTTEGAYDVVIKQLAVALCRGETAA